MSSVVTEATLEKKFMAVSNTQDSIQTLSLWLLHHKAHHQKIVNTWLKVLKKDKISHRLTLFYLANDVIQNCKRKNVSFFKESFADVLKDATLLVRDEQIRRSIDRVFKIWEERNVYDSDFIADLQGILNHPAPRNRAHSTAPLKNSFQEANAKVPATAPSKLLAEFKYEKVVEKIRAVKKLEMETSTKTTTVNLSKLNATDAEIVQKLKDRKHGQQFSREFDENARCLEELLKTMSKEIEERNQLILLLEQSEIFYDTQRGEAKIVANAYKNFGARVKTLQKKLDELIATFPSPVPSPCPDAPSPSNSDVEAELNLPGEKAGEIVDSEPEMSASSSVSSSSKVVATTTVGNPIPTVSNMFSQEPGSMTSWLDTFTKKNNSPALTTAATTTTSSGTSKDAGSLDSRLSNLLQNIPNLPSGLQQTLFGTTLADNSASESVTNSPASLRKSGSSLFHNADAQTPLKDEYSGQNTPLQDEDTPSSGATFFTRLAATPKASQSPKEILQGLKNFIQSASSISSEKPHNLQENSLSWPSDKSEQNEKGDISNSGKTVISSFSDASLSFSSTGFKTSQHSVSTTVGQINNTTSSQITTNSSRLSFSDSLSYAPMLSSSETSVSQSIHQNLSFIPTLVPSTPTGSNFNFGSENTFSDYCPDDMQNFETDMDIDSGDEIPSIAPNDEPTDVASDEKTEENLDSPRPSTLITLVTDNGASDTTPELKSEIPVSYSESDRYHSTIESVYQIQKSEWPVNPVVPDSMLLPPPPVNLPLPEIKQSTISASCETQESLNEAYFLSSPPPPPFDFGYPNGKRGVEAGIKPNDLPQSKIETVQSHRTVDDEKWGREDWNEFKLNQRRHPGDQQHRPYNRRPVEYHDYQHKRQFGGPRFAPRNNWQNMNRPPVPSYERGPPPKRFAPFFPRRRGWNRHPPQY